MIKFSSIFDLKILWKISVTACVLAGVIAAAQPASAESVSPGTYRMQWADKWGEFAYSTTDRQVVTKYRNPKDPKQHFTFEHIDGDLYRIKTGNGTYLTDPGTGNWSYIELAAANGSDNQKWRVVHLSGDAHKIQSVADGSQHLFSWGSYEGGEMGTHHWKDWGSQRIDLIPVSVIPSAQCTDGIQNQTESDVDCGGVCPGCDDGDTCNQDSDCLSGNCTSGACTADGGDCSASGQAEIVSFNVTPGSVAPGGQTTLTATVCPGQSFSGQVQMSVYDANWNKVQLVEGDSQIQDKFWFDTDFTAGRKKTFVFNAGIPDSLAEGDYRPGFYIYPGDDWTSKVINHHAPLGTLAVASDPEPEPEPDPQCTDGIQNQNETDVDCGGVCPGCNNGDSCNEDSDCASSSCLSGTCQASTDDDITPPQGYPKLLFNDEFDGNAIDIGMGSGTKWAPGWISWNTRHLAGNSDDCWKQADHEHGWDSAWQDSGRSIGDALRSDPGFVARYGNGPFNHEVSNGSLKMRAFRVPASIRNTDNGGMEFTGGMISTEDRFSFKHGWMEMRVRFTRVNQGMHFAYWTLSQDNKRWVADYGPEYDPLEVLWRNPSLGFERPNHWHQNAIGISNAGLPTDPWPFYVDVDYSAWHTVVLERGMDNKVRYYIDSKLTREDDISTMSQYRDENHYLLCTWEIGGNWPGEVTSTDPYWSVEVEIDYIRVFGP